jgi:cbb3-type cytochrome oxidase maturation protein
MSVVIILMLASLAVGLVFVGAFVWSVRSGQYEDTHTPSLRVLLDDATPLIHSEPADAPAAPGPAAAIPRSAAYQQTRK